MNETLLVFELKAFHFLYTNISYSFINVFFCRNLFIVNCCFRS